MLAAVLMTGTPAEPGVLDWLKSPLSTSDEPVRVQIGNWPMAIPKVYLDAPLQRKEGPSEEGFTLITDTFMVMELPEMTPRSNIREWMQHRGWKNSRWVHVLLRPSSIGKGGPSDMFYEIYSGITSGVEPQKAGSEYGLDRLTTQVASSKRDIFVKYENDERTVLIVCDLEGRSAEGKVPHPSCSQFISLRPDLQAKITYGRQYLPRWQEIEAKVRGVIDGFIADAASVE